MRKVFVVVLALGALQPGLSSAGAQGTPVPPQTPVEIELLENLSSQTMQAGQSIGFKVVRPVLVNGTTLLEAGAQVTGEVKNSTSVAGVCEERGLRPHPEADPAW